MQDGWHLFGHLFAAALYLLTNHQLGPAILLTFFGIVISTTDNLLRLVLIGKQVALHPFLLFFGVFGGLAAAGPMGLIYGLLVVATLSEAILIYREQVLDFSHREPGSELVAPPAQSTSAADSG